MTKHRPMAARNIRMGTGAAMMTVVWIIPSSGPRMSASAPGVKVRAGVKTGQRA